MGSVDNCAVNSSSYGWCGCQFVGASRGREVIGLTATRHEGWSQARWAVYCVLEGVVSTVADQRWMRVP